ncbi:calcium/sodium antiporter [bacterium]|nr:calcium/sodium antiporter [bacterium]
MLIYLLLLVVGFAAVIKGADFLVDGASGLARKYGVSELAIGLTVVAFGTSAPELAVNVQADDEIVFGNIIGSNNFNLLGILGISGLIFPMLVQRKTIFIELPFSILVLSVFLLLCNDGLLGTDNNTLSRFDACMLLLGFVIFLVYVFKTSKQEIISEAGEHPPKPLGTTLLMIALGLAGLVIGGKLIVDNASNLARMAHVSETMIGLTIVSMGTSLPELATSLVAALKKRPDLAVGNIIGSNLFNVLLIMGVSALIRPRTYNPELNYDTLTTIIGTIVIFISLLLFKTKKLGAYQSFILLAMFVVYYIYVMNRELHWF